jgi:hypothetical protein
MRLCGRATDGCPVAPIEIVAERRYISGTRGRGEYEKRGDANAAQARVISWRLAPIQEIAAPQ